MNWDEYFLRIAKEVAGRSHCLSRQIGAILVKNRSIISTGYNGPPRGFPHCDEKSVFDRLNLHTDDLGTCPRQVMDFTSGGGLQYCPAVHAEVNAIANAARLGVSTKNTTMYLTCNVPCKDCLAVIINAGITEVVVPDMDDFYDTLSQEMAQYIYLREYDVVQKWGVWYDGTGVYSDDTPCFVYGESSAKMEPEPDLRDGDKFGGHVVFFSEEKATEWADNFSKMLCNRREMYTVIPYNDKMYWIECRPGDYVKADPGYTKEIGSVTDGYHDGSPIFKTPARARAWMDAVDKHHLSTVGAAWSNEAHKIVEFKPAK